MPRERKLSSKERARNAELAAIAASTWFTLVQFIGRSGYERGPISAMAQYERWDFKAEDHGSGPAALEAARRARAALPRDPYGRRPIVYAVSPSGVSIFVE